MTLFEILFSFQIASRICWVIYLAYWRAASQPCRHTADESCFRVVGIFCWMLILFTHTVMESCSDVQMEYWDVSFHRSSCIWLITQKSASFLFIFILLWNTNHHSRALIATIKDMGSCPCPRCFMPKASFDLLGVFKDMRDRVTKLRTYSLARVTEAREYIYKWGNTVNGSKVLATLGQGSWVPTVVRLTS